MAVPPQIGSLPIERHVSMLNEELQGFSSRQLREEMRANNAVLTVNSVKLTSSRQLLRFTMTMSCTSNDSKVKKVFSCLSLGGEGFPPQTCSIDLIPPCQWCSGGGNRGFPLTHRHFLFQPLPLNMSSILPVENIDTAAAAAGKVVLEKLNLQLGQRDITDRGLSQAPIPLYGITWNRDVIDLVAKDSINQLFVRLRNSPLS